MIYLFCSYFMTGVIWLIQLIHYPSFQFVDAAHFNQFHRRHSSVMGFLVGPIMIVELLTALWMASRFEIQWVIQALLVIMLWGFTFLISVPIHQALEKSKNEVLILKLVRTNWLRTFVWTFKAGLLFYLVKIGCH